ncbi:MAG: hypothetical protein B7X76_08270 [Azorhizobium sp. 39-67-5]|nr:MAG: hypothetical protein B7X76_08270 [Azorhizobium sp. 39-67-5]
MPPFLLAAAGVLGAAALVKLIARESRRVSAQVDAHRVRTDDGKDAPEPAGVKLERDPVTGAYRPRADA